MTNKYRALLVFLMILISNLLRGQGFYATGNYNLVKPDTIRLNDTISYSFYPIVPGAQSNTFYDVNFAIYTSFNSIDDTNFAIMSRKSVAAYTVLYNSLYYSTITFRPKNTGKYTTLLVLSDPKGKIRSDTLVFNVVVLDTLSGSYCNVSPTSIDFGTTNPLKRRIGNFLVINPYYSTDSFTVNVVGPRSNNFVFAPDNKPGLYTFFPGQRRSFSIDAITSDTGTFRDTIYLYSTTTVTKDTLAVPLLLTVIPLLDIKPFTIEAEGSITLSISPNPTEQNTTLSFGHNKPAAITVQLYDVLGNRRMVLADGIYQSGIHTIPIDTKDLPQGSYFVRLQTSGQVVTKKLIVQ